MSPMVHILKETANLMLKETSEMMDFNSCVLQMSLLKPRVETQWLYQGHRDSLNNRPRSWVSYYLIQNGIITSLHWSAKRKKSLAGRKQCLWLQSTLDIQYVICHNLHWLFQLYPFPRFSLHPARMKDPSVSVGIHCPHNPIPRPLAPPPGASQGFQLLIFEINLKSSLSSHPPSHLQWHYAVSQIKSNLQSLISKDWLTVSRHH
jgi:hypothetical protein